MLALLRAGRNLARLVQIGFILARYDALFMLDRVTVLLPLLAVLRVLRILLRTRKLIQRWPRRGKEITAFPRHESRHCQSLPVRLLSYPTYSQRFHTTAGDRKAQGCPLPCGHEWKPRGRC